MKILLTNDDGIDSYGLRVLAEELSRIGEVSLAAPVNNNSGAGHGMTVTEPLRAYPRRYAAITGPAWAVAGTPVDCVKLAIDQLLPEKPDIVISGINNGPNLGTDIIYSGTVAAALEGWLHQLPALAVSVANEHRHTDDGNYLPAARIAADYAGRLCSGQLPRTLLNINVPGAVPEDIRGIKYAGMGWRWYTGAYEKRTDPSGHDYYWLTGQPYDTPRDGTTDVEVIAKGFVSVTPLFSDLTDRELLRQLRG
ncbi:MAG: 5'/3'-nucleotidase SurE [Firmicutes bacterium]|nr:5'/3'-nucleotidase SurE [Bacillota bacterium]